MDVWEEYDFEKDNVKQGGTITRVLKGLLFDKRDWSGGWLKLKGRGQWRRARCLKVSGMRKQTVSSVVC